MLVLALFHLVTLDVLLNISLIFAHESSISSTFYFSFFFPSCLPVSFCGCFFSISLLHSYVLASLGAYVCINSLFTISISFLTFFVGFLFSFSKQSYL